MNAVDFLSFARHLFAVLVGAGIGLSQALDDINISECSVACVKKKAARTHSTPNMLLRLWELDTGAIVFVAEGKKANVLQPFWRRLRASLARNS